MKASSLLLFALSVLGAVAEPTVVPTMEPSIEPTLEPYVQKFDIVGVLALVAFYLIVIGVGIWASKKQKADTAVELALAGRNFSGLMGIITMVATWVCGGYLYGTTQGIVTEGSGLAWTQAPWCYGVCFFIGGLLFCKKMREKEYITMFDPFSEKFKSWMVALLYIPACLGDIFWIAMALSTLGYCLSVLLGVSTVAAILLSAVCSCFLAFVGGMYSVAYTDVVQLVIMLICLFICIPFVATSEYVGDISKTKDIWLGSVASSDWGSWIDYALLMCLGGIPWQVYFQRVLSSKTVKDSQVMSMWSGIGAMICAIPPALMGIYATTVDWSQFPEVQSLVGKESSALSYIIKYLTPTFITYLGLGGIAAATLSTADGAYLASATVFTINVYKPLIRPKCSEKEITVVARIMMIVICICGTILAIVSDSVYNLWVLTSDLIYVMLFPQLLLTVYWPDCMNTYGSLVGYIVGAILRFGGGESTFGIPRFIPYPGWFPFRTVAVIVGIVLMLGVSIFFRYMIVTKGKKGWDFFGDYYKQLPVKTPDLSATPDSAATPADSGAAPAQPQAKAQAPASAPAPVPAPTANDTPAMKTIEVPQQ